MRRITFEPIAWAVSGNEISPVVLALGENFIILDFLGQDIYTAVADGRCFDNIQDAFNFALELAHDDDWQGQWTR